MRTQFTLPSGSAFVSLGETFRRAHVREYGSDAKIRSIIHRSGGKYLPLFTDTGVNNCFSIYKTSG